MQPGKHQFFVRCSCRETFKKELYNVSFTGSTDSSVNLVDNQYASWKLFIECVIARVDATFRIICRIINICLILSLISPLPRKLFYQPITATATRREFVSLVFAGKKKKKKKKLFVFC